jgi:hypothetical protein
MKAKELTMEQHVMNMKDVINMLDDEQLWGLNRKIHTKHTEHSCKFSEAYLEFERSNPDYSSEDMYRFIKHNKDKQECKRLWFVKELIAQRMGELD